MNLKEDLDRDMRQFFRHIENQLPEGKLDTLKLLIEKYCHLSSTPAKFDKHDFDLIKQASQRFFINESLPKVVGDNRRIIEGADLRILAIVEGTVTYLQGQDCLKKLPIFDYKEQR